MSTLVERDKEAAAKEAARDAKRTDAERKVIAQRKEPLNITGKVVSSSIVDSRDSVDLLLRIQIKDGNFDVHADSNSYCDRLATVAMTCVADDHWKDLKKPEIVNRFPNDRANRIARSIQEGSDKGVVDTSRHTVAADHREVGHAPAARK